MLEASWEDALLFRTLATLRLDVPVFASLEELRWSGPTAGFAALCERLQATGLDERAEKAAARVTP